METACTEGSQKRCRFASPYLKERSDESEPHSPMKTPRIEDLVKMIRKQINGDKPRPSRRARIFHPEDLRLPSFGRDHLPPVPKEVRDNNLCHTGVTDLVQHLRAYLVKITVHSNDDLMCRVFPSCLKGVALDWFYSLLSRSLQSFEVVSCALFNQYASR